jgi:MCP family monocarboxylic acid transporter-like MFS transporter 10
MIGGSFLLVFCLFMLSITEAEQYYQVKIKEGLRRPDATFIRYF